VWSSSHDRPQFKAGLPGGIESPASEVVLALPDVPGYRGLVEKVKNSLLTLRIRVLLVGRNGAVRDSAES
jgi:hypothetical protein